MTKGPTTRLRHSAVLAALTFAWLATPAAAEVVFLSTQLRPIESAQKLRSEILKDFPGGAEFVTEQPPQLGVHIRAEQQAGKPVSSLIGALHGELQPLAAESLVPLDDVLETLKDRGLNPGMVEAGKLGTTKQMFIPWMQATYIMVANKQALPFLPAGADINALTYDQLAQWGANIQAKTGKRMIGFPAGPTGLMHRFFEGYLYPSYTGGVVTTFKSPDAVAMWTTFRDLWKTVNPNSTNYGFMQEPLLSGDVWIAFDHVARLIDALSRKPDDFVAFPAPSGPKGLGYMPVVAGLAIAKGAPQAEEAKQLIAYLTRPDMQVKTAKAVAFFPVVKVDLPGDIDPGLKLEIDAVQKMTSAKNALVSLLPVGLDQRGGEFDKVYLDTFQRIVLRGEDPKAALDRQGQALKRIIAETKARCWLPDKPSDGPCPVE
ncbi:MAG: carbohydrate ABC transporter substrate-binding protein [Bosea sp.]|uniref:ABC transporter substrate-binding protein n=1 Tax=unclassified Bosea (in: a-proteobacteria) TaxID=2653178 RepID=UPI00095DFB88|nr:MULTISPECIES: ABC transporter substrate-binding protein [unclassified Bosea (in: a-proteobacteria)]MBN9459242.1 carbohydrate ABC transporter substrate-binding protein [Bosea sp. (in: a-proteobacteria)]OJV07579.1 MAG: ABC transporter substrate-binding protein [Bosea sp. 67-29]